MHQRLKYFLAGNGIILYTYHIKEHSVNATVWHGLSSKLNFKRYDSATSRSCKMFNSSSIKLMLINNIKLHKN